MLSNEDLQKSIQNQLSNIPKCVLLIAKVSHNEEVTILSSLLNKVWHGTLIFILEGNFTISTREKESRKPMLLIHQVGLNEKLESIRTTVLLF